VYGRARPSGGPSLYFAAVNAEFNWWLLIVGLVVGAGLVWLVLMDARRRDVDVDDTERPREALWLSRTLADEGHAVSPEVAERLLILHRSYLEAPAPDDPTAGPVAPHEAVEDAPPPTKDGSELSAEDRLGVQGRAPDVSQ
jgi:hypothetical protein